jgi:DNA-binding SARP family transcriptional activator
MENYPESVKQDIIKEIKELMTEDPYFRDAYQVILELFEKGRDETAYKLYFLIQ